MIELLKNNNICFCGSGKTYSECHGNLELFSRNELVAFDQGKAFNMLKNKSKLLESFLDNVLAHTKRDVYLVLKQGQSNNWEFAQECIYSNKNTNAFEYYVIFYDPEIRTRGSVIAHEFNHILLNESNYPFLLLKHEFDSYLNIRLNTSLTNLMQHKLIYDNLMDLGFNVKQDFFNIALPNYKKMVGFPKEPLAIKPGSILNKIFIFNFAEKIILFEVLDLLTDTNIVNLLNFCKIHYPILYKQAKKISNRYIEMDNTSIYEQKNFLCELLEKYSIDHYFDLFWKLNE